LLLLITFIVNFVVVYRRKQFKNYMEQEILKTEMQKELLKAQMEIQEQTFSFISQEIHDNVGQVLSLAKVQLSLVEQRGEIQEKDFEEIKANIGKAITDLRDIAKGLNSDRIQYVDFNQAVEQELNRVNRIGIVNTSLVVHGTPQTISQQAKLILFRIVQESLQNVIKHSRAKNVLLLFQYGKDMFELSIQDDGIGFQPSTIPDQNGLGLSNIVNRANFLGGHAEIKSNPGSGTTIKLTIPYA
jgi:two-component system, NarL family, sensor kinase